MSSNHRGPWLERDDAATIPRVNVRTLPLDCAPLEGVVVHLLDFDPTVFDPEDFGRHRIDRPVPVERSVTSRQAEFLHGRLAARAGLAALNRGTEQVGIGDHREPLWPDGVVGSISHTRTVAAAAVLRRDRCACVGIDLAELVSDALEPSLLRLALNQQETALLREGQSRDAFRSALTVAFSAKESLFKALFPAVGRYFGFDAAIVTAFAPEERAIRLALTASLAPGLAAGQTFTLAFTTCSARTVLTSLVVDRTGLSAIDTRPLVTRSGNGVPGPPIRRVGEA